MNIDFHENLEGIDLEENDLLKNLRSLAAWGLPYAERLLKELTEESTIEDEERAHDLETNTEGFTQTGEDPHVVEKRDEQKADEDVVSMETILCNGETFEDDFLKPRTLQKEVSAKKLGEIQEVTIIRQTILECSPNPMIDLENTMYFQEDLTGKIDFPTQAGAYKQSPHASEENASSESCYPCTIL